MPRREAIVILDGARRTPRVDILENNRGPGLFSRFSTTQLGGMAIGATLAHTSVDKALVGHVVMGMAAHSHRDSIYGVQGMRWRGFDWNGWRVVRSVKVEVDGNVEGNSGRYGV